MTVKLRKPILIGGLGLSLVFWLWDSIQHLSKDISEYAVLTSIALGSVLWLLRRKNSQDQLLFSTLSNIDRKAVTEAISKAQTTIDYLQTEAPEQDISDLKEKLDLISASQHRENLEIAVIGGIRVGKTTITQLLSTQNNNTNISFIDLQNPDYTTYLKADVVLFIINGDLTASEGEIIQKLRDFHHRILVVLNKEDRYLLEERSQILQKIRSSLAEIIISNDIISIAAAPAPVKVKKYLQDGTVKESIEAKKADLKLLNQRLNEIVSNEKQQLILASTWRQAKQFKNQVQDILNQVRNNRSQPIIEQYQWLSAAAAFANPVSALDLLATAAINAQMLIDLGAIYQQKISFEQAQNAASTIGKIMVKLGIVELSTQAIASILKTNTITYVAGGIAQGVSAAYLTRIAGLSLIAYYQEQEVAITEEKFNLDRLTDKLKQIFADNQKVNILKKFVSQTLNNKQLKLTN